jgi:hypothetical protein
MPPTGRGCHAQVVIERPHVLSRSGVPEPEFDVEYEVLAAGAAGGPQPLIVGCLGRGGRGGQVVTGGLLAGAHGADRQVRGVRVLLLPYRLPLACPGPGASGGAVLCRGWLPGMLSRTRRTGCPRSRAGTRAKAPPAPKVAGSRRKPGSLRCRGPRRRAAGHGRRLGAGTFYRGTALTFPRGARCTSRLACRPACAGRGRRMAWAGRSREPGWDRFARRAAPRQLALFGFPPPGHPYRTEATLDGTA